MKNSGETFSYVVLARKWRPMQFADIVGQSHVVRTLMNAIRTNRLHQAYLFAGSRGIGKTSIARIFARAIRCEQSKQDGDSILSCGECSSCKEITAGNSVDVIEIDGASNNGVEAVREIRENAKYMPSNGARKIYIIDEVHMLTTAAFNALLKTLEEPPAHVIFMFATTEPHKIPATILSRCQRFDLRRVTLTQIQPRLIEVAQSEGLKVEAGALALIARAAEGSMRDAMSLLDQVIAFAGNEITVQAVRDSVGLIEGETLLGILKAVFARKPVEALALVEQAYQRGHDLRVLGRSLIEFLHAAVLAKIGAPPSQNLELSEDEWKELKEATESRELEEIEMIFQVLHHGLDWIARSPQPKAVLDVLLVKCATAEALVYAEQSGSKTSTVSAGQRSAPSPAASHSAISTPKPTAAKILSAPTAVQAPAPVIPAAQSQTQFQSQAPSWTPPSAATAKVQTPIPPQPSASAHSATSAQIAPAAAASASGQSASASAATTLAEPSGPKTWEGYIAYVRKTRPLLASILEHGSDAEISEADQTLALFYRTEESYYLKQLQGRSYHDQFLTLSKEYFGKPMRLTVELRDGGESLADKKNREQKERQDKARAAVQNNPIIREAQSLFGGELGPIELSDKDGDGHADT